MIDNNQTMTPYAATDGAQRRKIFKLLSQHTSITWGTGAKIAPMDLSRIKRSLYMTYSQANGLVFSTSKPQTPRCETKVQDMMRSIKSDYPVTIAADKAQGTPQATIKPHKGKAKAKDRVKQQAATDAQQGRLL